MRRCRISTMLHPHPETGTFSKMYSCCSTSTEREIGVSLSIYLTALASIHARSIGMHLIMRCFRQVEFHLSSYIRVLSSDLFFVLDDVRLYFLTSFFFLPSL
jgi:hypothetical protein